MSKLLSDCRGLVRSFLDEAAASASDWSDAELNTLINQRYHEVRSAVVTVYEDYYLTTDTFDSVEDQQEYGSTDGVPTDIFKIRRVELNYDVSVSTNAPTRCLPVQNIDAIRRDLGYQNTGTGVAVSSNANYFSYGFGSDFKIGFIPIPDKDGTDAIKLWYVKEATDLTESSTIDIPYADKNYILVVYGATADALRFGQQAVAEAGDFELKYRVGMEKMQEELEDRVAEESKSVLDVSGENLDFSAC